MFYKAVNSEEYLNLMVWLWCVFVFWLACPSVTNYVGL